MNSFFTFQDFQAHESDRAKWIGQAIAQYMKSDEYKIAQEADLYEKQQNTRIKEYVKKVYDITGVASVDITNPNIQIASNFFHRLNTQRASYSLGNGVSFAGKTTTEDGGKRKVSDKTKERLGNSFDDILYRVGFKALEHGVCYCLYNDGEYYIFPMLEFLPFMDEMTGKIRAGARFWSLDWKRMPVIVDLYEEDGYSRYKTPEGKRGLGRLELVQEKTAYKQIILTSEADGEEVVKEENYTTLPIAVMYGNKNRQSTLVGMKANIDAYDLIQSGYANDLAECAQMYWIIDNAAGMNDDDIKRLRDRMLLQHMVVADELNSSIKPYAQDIPYNSREACLSRIRDTIYSDFGALDVKSIGAGANITATEIRAAYQTVDEEADDFEFQANEFIQQILKLIGIEDYPTFDRNKVSNAMEETQMVMLAAEYLDSATVLKKLPFVSVDEVDAILESKDQENAKMVGMMQAAQQAEGQEEPEEEVE
jgi:hypothetical protein